MILTSRDQSILRDLQSYGIHTTRNLARRHFPGIAKTTVLRRLRRIESSGYIRRIPGLEAGGYAWSLTPKSAAAFLSLASKIHFPRFILDHDLKLTDLRIQLEGAGIARSWLPEHEIRAKVAASHGTKRLGERTIPDGLMGVEVGDLKESIAVELELSNKNQRRYQRIFRDYGNKKCLWAFWYVVHSQSIARQLTKAARESWHRGNHPYFLWSLLTEVMNDPLNATVHSYDSSYRLCELWTPGDHKSPAHTPAQGMSTEAKNADVNASELSG